MSFSIPELIKKVKSGKYDSKELVALYHNVNKNKDRFPEQDIEDIVEAIELELREKFPKAAKKMFGAKESAAVELLEKLRKGIIQTQDLSKNKLKNTVKTGGLMMLGDVYIEVYISYKNRNNQGVFLALLQDTVDSELRVKLTRYSTNGADESSDFEQLGGIDDFDELAGIYQNTLKKLI